MPASVLKHVLELHTRIVHQELLQTSAHILPNQFSALRTLEITATEGCCIVGLSADGLLLVFTLAALDPGDMHSMLLNAFQVISWTQLTSKRANYCCDTLDEFDHLHSTDFGRRTEQIEQQPDPLLWQSQSFLLGN